MLFMCICGGTLEVGLCAAAIACIVKFVKRKK
jgi:hypothetical protein